MTIQGLVKTLSSHFLFGGVPPHFIFELVKGGHRRLPGLDNSFFEVANRDKNPGNLRFKGKEIQGLFSRRMAGVLVATSPVSDLTTRKLPIIRCIRLKVS